MFILSDIRPRHLPFLLEEKSQMSKERKPFCKPILPNENQKPSFPSSLQTRMLNRSVRSSIAKAKNQPNYKYTISATNIEKS